MQLSRAEHTNIRTGVMEYLFSKLSKYPLDMRSNAIHHMDVDLLTKFYFPKTDRDKADLLKEIVKEGVMYYKGRLNHEYNKKFIKLMELEFITLDVMKEVMDSKALQSNEQEFMISVLNNLGSNTESHLDLAAALLKNSYFLELLKPESKKQIFDKMNSINQNIDEVASVNPSIIIHYYDVKRNSNTNDSPQISNLSLAEVEHAKQEAKKAQDVFEHAEKIAKEAEKTAKEMMLIAQQKANESALQLEKLQSARNISKQTLQSISKPLASQAKKIPPPPPPLSLSSGTKKPPPPPPPPVPQVSIANLEHHVSTARKEAKQAIAEAEKARIKATRLIAEAKVAAEQATVLAKAANTKSSVKKPPPPPPPKLRQ